MEGTEPIVRRRRERQFRTTEEKWLIVGSPPQSAMKLLPVSVSDEQ